MSSDAAAAGPRVVYVRPFPGLGGATQVSLEGGEFPVWAPDGKSLYFVANGRQLVAASLAPGATMGVTGRRVLMTSAYLVLGSSRRPAYSVSPDGKRFVGLSLVNNEAKLVVVTNWLAELRRSQAGVTGR